MKRTIFALSAITALSVVATPIAAALTSSQVKECKAMGADLQARQVKAQKLADERLALVDEVEAAGEAWEDVEIHRRASAGHAAKADEAKAVYNGLKTTLMAKEVTLQDLVASLNGEVASYNRKCVKK